MVSHGANWLIGINWTCLSQCVDGVLREISILHPYTLRTDPRPSKHAQGGRGAKKESKDKCMNTHSKTKLHLFGIIFDLDDTCMHYYI